MIVFDILEKAVVAFWIVCAVYWLYCFKQWMDHR